MVMLRIEHPVPDFEGWKEAFDSDPMNRKKSGVRRYRILRPTDDPRYVMIDLELGTRQEAEELLAALQVLWGRVEGKVMTNARARIFEPVEIREL